jgi:ABC-type phosphate transport system substrate-binding protein
VNISHRLRAGVVAGALCTVGLTAQSIAAQAVAPPVNGPYCSGGVGVTGPGSTAQINALPGFNSTLQAGGEVDGLGNTVPPCTTESATDSGGGSGAGVAAAVAHSAPMSFSDDPLSQTNYGLATAGSGTNGSPIHQVPVAILPVSVIFNLSCFTGTLNLSGLELGKMYDGVVTQWNDQTLLVDNPGLTACAGHKINLTARADVSGTTFVFKSYLSHSGPEYVALKQDAANTTWLADTTGNPIACRGAGTGGEIACVNNTADSVGYAGSSNVRKSTTPPAEAAVDDPEHMFLKWTAGSCALAALTAPVPPTTTSPHWYTVDLTDSAAPGAYSICGYTYDFAFQNYATAGVGTMAQMQTVVDFLTAATSTKGQATLPTDTYDELPVTTQTIAQMAPLEITFK